MKENVRRREPRSGESSSPSPSSSFRKEGEKEEEGEGGRALQVFRSTLRGFTLVELLVTIAVLAVLMVIAIPTFQKVAAGGKATACVGNLRQIGVALNTYLGEHNMTMPSLAAGRKRLEDDAPVIDNTLDRYVQDKRVFRCPADDKRYAETTGTSYHWNVTLNGQAVASLRFLRLTDEPGRIPILGDKEGFHPYIDNRVNILYADGHATKDLKFWSENDAGEK